MAKAKGKPAGELPTPEELLRFIKASSNSVDKRDIAHAYGLKGAQRAWLRDLLRELEDAGEIERGEKRRYRPVGTLPEIAVIEVAGRDPDGELLGRPADWTAKQPPPAIYLAPDRAGAPALDRGTRVLARLDRQADGSYDAIPIRILAGQPRRVLGVLEAGGILRPTDKRQKVDYILRPDDAGGAETGEFLLCQVKPSHRRGQQDTREVRVLERLGHIDSPKAISLIAIHENDIPVDFPDKAIEEATATGPPKLDGRVDLREVPLVTIDGADAKDFDDAVYAEPDETGDNKGGYRIVVAIADVARYVQAGSSLDKAAHERGNSVYFPDRVVPMLPETLSNGWCSLRPHEDRGCLAAEMRIDGDGKLLDHRFFRGLMRSAARLTYEQVQAARDGETNDLTAPLAEPVIAPLYGAFRALLRHRDARGTLDLDLTEKQVIVDDSGSVTGIETRQRLDAHRLIEEFMICANVAAAETLEKLKQPCMYRVHEPPDPDKVDALRETLRTYGLNLAKDQAARPEAFGRVLEKVKGRPEAPMLNELVLRCQSQAYYSPDNLGHFGLALQRYAHFTSPIRRYSDLLVHRALIDGLKLGDDGLRPGDAERFQEIGEHISQTERRAQRAEYDAIDRFTAAFLKEQVGATFLGRVGGVTRFGLFVTLHDTGADGLVPIATLPNDFYHHDASKHRLVGERWGRVYRLGDQVRVRLADADPMTGGIVLEMIEVMTTAAGDKPEEEPVTPGGPGKGRRRQAARTGKTARDAEKKRRKAEKGGAKDKFASGPKKAKTKAGHKADRPKTADRTRSRKKKANAKPKI